MLKVWGANVCGGAFGVSIAESSELGFGFSCFGGNKPGQEIFSWFHQWKDPKDNLIGRAMLS
ncbi:MAG: hypothetical protein CM1200mP12_21250 [Gammaproteobacteria bacterium]|nr:MAG: hypothetical protein CM1200mP12_21250 [Gammaproteobacteria bacterium]